MPEYIFKGRGNYGGEAATPTEWEEAFAAAPACHNLGHTARKKIMLEDLGPDERNAIIAHDTFDDIDAKWEEFNTK